MKKLLLVAIGWMIFSSCAKTVNTPVDDSNTAALSVRPTADDPANSEPVKATARIVYKRPGPVGGPGWVLYTGREEWEVPDNLPAEYQKENIYVAVTYSKTDKVVPGTEEQQPKYYVFIIDISRAKPPSGSGE